MVSALLVAACVRSADQDEAPESAGDPPVVSALPDGDAAPPEAPRATPVPDSDTRMVLTDAGRARSERAPRAQVDPREAAFAALRQQALPSYPADFVIGPLAALDGPTRRVRDYTRRVLVAIVTTASDDGAIAPAYTFSSPGASFVADDLRVAVAAIAAGRAADRDGFDLRVGAPRTLPGTEFSVPFRVFDRSRSYAGEVIVGAIDGEWYTTDIQVADDRTLGAPYRPGADHGGL